MPVDPMIQNDPWQRRPSQGEAPDVRLQHEALEPEKRQAERIFGGKAGNQRDGPKRGGGNRGPADEGAAQRRTWQPERNSQEPVANPYSQRSPGRPPLPKRAGKGAGPEAADGAKQGDRRPQQSGQEPTRPPSRGSTRQTPLVNRPPEGRRGPRFAAGEEVGREPRTTSEANRSTPTTARVQTSADIARVS